MRLTSAITLAVAVSTVACGDSSSESGSNGQRTASSLQLRYQKISQSEGGFGGELSDHDAFGSSVAPLGDLDGDGVADLAVGAIWDEDEETLLAHGSVWILFLNPDATVRDQAKIEPGAGGLPPVSADPAMFGLSITGIGDIDGDGVPDMAVGEPQHGWSPAVWILLLTADGRVKAHRRITGESIGDEPGYWGVFGWSVLGLGDLDGEGRPELLVSTRASLHFLTLSPTGDVVRTTSVTGDETGAANERSLVSLGDIDRDGTSDVIAETDVLRLRPEGGVREVTVITSSWLGGHQLDWGSPASMGDLDGDGVNEIAVLGRHYRPRPDQAATAIVVLYLDRNGNVRSYRKLPISRDELTTRLLSYPLNALAGLGDIDGDGVVELAIGARGDDDGGPGRGAVWIVSMENPTDVATTSTTLTTTTTFVTTTTAYCSPEYCGDESAGSLYDVEFHLAPGRPLGALGFRVEYDPMLGYFLGSGALAHCAFDPESNDIAAVHDCDGKGGWYGCSKGVLRIVTVRISGIEGPRRLTTCSFRSISGPPVPDDFSVVVEDASAVNLRPADAALTIAVAPAAMPE